MKPKFAFLGAGVRKIAKLFGVYPIFSYLCKPIIIRAPRKVPKLRVNSPFHWPGRVVRESQSNKKLNVVTNKKKLKWTH